MQKRFEHRPSGSSVFSKSLTVLHVVFVILCYLVAVLSCLFFFTEGKDGISIMWKILYIPIALCFAWIIAETPKQILYYLTNTGKVHTFYFKLRLIVGVLSIFALSIIFLILTAPSTTYQNTFIPNTIAPAGSAQFIDTFAGLTNASVQHGDAVLPITTGSVFEQLLVQSIGAASSTIDFTTFPWADGTFSTDVFTALTAAANRGVQVRLLLDSFGSRSIARSEIYALQKAGGQVVEYHPFNILEPFAYDDRSHVRSIVVDGKTAFTGGMGISGDWFGSTPDKTFEDMMFEVHGAMTASLQNSFSELWNEATGEIISGPEFYASIANTPTDNEFVSITSIPSANYEPVRNAFMLTALSAQKKLYIVSSYIVPDQALLTILEDKARAGVDVRIVSPGYKTAAPVLRDAWHADYAQLLGAGVKIYEYQPTMIHTKFMVVDDVWSLIGSANVDNRSEALNAENLLGINDPVLASSLDQSFMTYVSHSTETTQADWQHQYGFFAHFYSNMLLLFAKQY
jgi:cardiolipin synthase